MRYVIAVASSLALLVLTVATASAERGYTTWYGPGFHGNRMANGQVFDENDPTTTASNQFPFGTWIKVTNPGNGRSVVVQVRDRGGFGHALDLSKAAFFALAPPNGWGFWVEYEVVSGPDAAAKPPPPKPAPPKPTPAPAPKATPAPALKPVSPPAPAPAPAKAASSSTEHVVAPGEMLRAIAERHDRTVQQLIEWNAIETPDALKVGQRLRLTPPTRNYVVQPGDTLRSIAEALDVALETILKNNEIDDPDSLAIGQELTIPA